MSHCSQIDVGYFVTEGEKFISIQVDRGMPMLVLDDRDKEVPGMAHRFALFINTENIFGRKPKDVMIQVLDSLGTKGKIVSLYDMICFMEKQGLKTESWDDEDDDKGCMVKGCVPGG